jgi:hypothetical protein
LRTRGWPPWINQVEQQFSILWRKPLRAADVADLQAKILAFIDEWTVIAQPSNWTAKSFDKALNRWDDPQARCPHGPTASSRQQRDGHQLVESCTWQKSPCHSERI